MSPVYATDADRRRQAEVARILDAAWGCEHYEFAAFFPIDWYAVKAAQVIGVSELKCRNIPHDEFSTVFFSVRKWIALNMAQIGLGVPAVFVVRFTDEIRWIRVGLNMGELTLGGTDNGIIGRAGKEPVIEVPIDEMRVVRSKEPQ